MVPLSFLLAVSVFGDSSAAAELAWDGHYRARAQYFDSLSLSETNGAAEGAAFAVDHRLRLQPGFLLSDKVGLFLQLDVLPFVQWGDQATRQTDLITGELEPVVYSDAVGPPTTDTGAATLANIQATRLWGEADFGVGRLRFGRVPVEWGTGMVFNAGNDPDDEFGDTADRIQFTGKAGQVYLMGAWEQRYEGLTNDPDDYKALAGAIFYKTEKAGVGSYLTYRWQRLDDGQSRWNTFIADVWGRAEMGPAKVQAEFAAVMGGGDLDTGANDLRTSAFGGNIDIALHPDKLRLGAMAGFAGGDGDTTDNKLHTFSFDPDFNVALMLFEEPMPTLEPAVSSDENDGRTTQAARSGYAVSNALFLRPRVGYQLLPELSADLSLITATRAKVPESEKATKGYGNEIDLTMRWDPMPHFWVQGTGGVFFPGKHYSEYEDDDFGSGFDQPAGAARVLGTIEF